MRDEDEQPSEDELREAAALAAALEGAPAAGTSTASANPDDVLETAALLRHARAPMAVPPAAEPVVAAQAAPLLDARRTRGRRRARVWIATSLAAPLAGAAVWLMVAIRSLQEPPAWLASAPPPAPTADLLAAQAQATRGGGQASAALARLDVEMRAYRRRYHEGLRRRLGDEP